MGRVFKRICAYFIDLLIVMIVVEAISGLSFINPDIAKYKKASRELSEYYLDYTSFYSELIKDYSDNKLEVREYNNLIEEYPDRKELLDKYYIDNKLSKKNYNKLLSVLNKQEEKKYNKLYYKAAKYSKVNYIVYLVVSILYFVFFNLITDGETLGKRLFRLKIVSVSNKKVSILNYFIRYIFLYSAIVYIGQLVGLFLVSSKDYYGFISIFSNIEVVFEVLVFMLILTTKDGRGIHDILSKTRVAYYDREGNEIINKGKILTFLDGRIKEQKDLIKEVGNTINDNYVEDKDEEDS